MRKMARSRPEVTHGARDAGLEMVSATLTVRNVKPKVVCDTMIDRKNSAWTTHRMKVGATFTVHSVCHIVELEPYRPKQNV